MCRGEGHGGDVQCGPAAESCPPGQYRRIVLLLRPGDTDWQEVGLVCLVDGAPTTVDDVAAQLKDVVVEDVRTARAVLPTEGRNPDRAASCLRRQPAGAPR